METESEALAIKGMYGMKEAAELIGVTSRRLRQMCVAYHTRCPTARCKPLDNECKGVREETDLVPLGYVWRVPIEEINRIKLIPPSKAGGRPRSGL